MLAADRNEAAASTVYDPISPAVLRLLALVAENAERGNNFVSICGDLAGDSKCVQMLLAFAPTELRIRTDALFDVSERVLCVSRKIAAL